MKTESEVAQSCPTLSDPTDCSLPGSSVHGIFQARILEGVAIAFSEGMLSKSLIQFSVDGQGYVPSLLFDLKPNYSGGNEDNDDFLQKVLCTHCALSALTLQQATTNPHLCKRFLDTHRQVCVNLLWGHCSFLLGPGMHKVFFVPPRICFPSTV